MFVLATLSSAGASGQVKIRNTSATGALIEGPALPAVGEQLHLSRGRFLLEDGTRRLLLAKRGRGSTAASR